MEVVAWLAALRFPFLFAFILLAIGLLAPKSPLLRGVFDVTPTQFWVVAATGLMAASSVVLTFWMVLEGAPQRLGLPPIVTSNAPPMPLLAGLTLLLAIPSMWAAWRETRMPEGWKMVHFSLATAGAGLVVGVLFYKAPEWARAFMGPATPIFQMAGPGYLDPDGGLKGNHAFATLWVAATTALYLALGFVRWTKLKQKADTGRFGVPTLACLFILVSQLSCTLAGLSYWLDHWRVPVLAILLAILALVALGFRRDHSFPLTAADIPSAPPLQVLEAGGGDRAIMVTAAGGGILLAAWTAKVLSELSKIPGFQKTVRLVSSVSGGSVGSLYWLQAVYEGDGSAPRVFEAASRSSLDWAAWGLVYPDFFRIFIPWVPATVDRGWAIEQAWRRGWEFPKGLSAWRAKVRDGLMPGVIFNTTAAESGEKIMCSTVDLDPPPKGLNLRRTFYEIHPGRDLTAVTAARLSATFPFVSPAARADKGETTHFVDGGYYDNYGTASLTQWLRDAVPADGSGRIKKILVVEITGFVPTGPAAGGTKSAAGWLYQCWAPIEALFGMRSASQRTRRHVELRLLKEALRGRGVELEVIPFDYPESDEPLSWHLTAPEIQSVVAGWEKRKAKAADVEAFLR